MPAAETLLFIEQGTTFVHSWQVTYNDALVDDTWTAQGQIRKYVGAEEVVAELDVSVNDQGAVTVSVSPEQSNAWTFWRGVYDVKIINDDQTVTLRVADGIVELDKAVTHA
jgi:hypothetical protein